jgi:SAM-dependent methyltransferase
MCRSRPVLKSSLFRFYWILKTQLGVDPRVVLRSLRGLPRFLLDLYHFRSNYSGRLTLRPCFQDRHEEGGAIKNEYFWQDLLVAREICSAQPERHVDVGSRIDGFVAHVASYREIEVFDVRPFSKEIPGMLFRQADLMDPIESLDNYCDSLSCLHALEHFGLGRYGDPLDPRGHEKGIASMSRLLKVGGVLYLSVPLGVPRVEFNAHRVFDPKEIVLIAAAHLLSLQRLTILHADGTSRDCKLDEEPFGELTSRSYTLGLFRFIKNKHQGCL